MEPLFPISYEIITWLQGFSPALDPLMKLVTFMGQFEFYMIFIPLVYFVIDRSLGLRILYLLVIGDAVGSYAKQLLRQPRPYWLGEVEGLAGETSYGMASTHASNSIALWGYIAYYVKKGWMTALSILIILLIGLSRLYLGVHYLHDVISGWLLGLLVLFVFIKSEDRVAAWWRSKSNGAQVGLGSAASLLIIVLGVLVTTLVSGTSDPPEWSAYSTEARSITNYFTLGGVLFGAISGAVLMFEYAPFQVRDAWWKRILRYLVGLAGVLVLYLGLDVLFAGIAADDSIPGYILRYIRYGSLSFWAVFLAPWLFIKVGLARRE